MAMKGTPRRISTIAMAWLFVSGPAAAGACQWTHRADGSDLGECVDNTGRTYCLTCAASAADGRVCTPTRCP